MGKRQDDKKVLIENVCQHLYTPIAPIPLRLEPGPGTPQYSFLLLPRVVNLNIYYNIYLFQDKEMYFVRYLWKRKLYMVCELLM